MSEKLVRNIIIIISLAVPTLVTILFFVAPPQIDLGIDLKFFPRFHAILNSLTTVALLLGLLFIQQKNITAHRASMISAFGLSSVFLVSYVFYHSMSTPTTFGGEGILKTIYYIILISHIVLAAVILPFILFTFYRALNDEIEKHKKIAKITFPVWLYVAVTGVLVYILISPYYV
jgi:putative membrane protein